MGWGGAVITDAPGGRGMMMMTTIMTTTTTTTTTIMTCCGQVLESLKAAGQKPNRMVRAYLWRHVKGHARARAPWVACSSTSICLMHDMGVLVAAAQSYTMLIHGCAMAMPSHSCPEADSSRSIVN
eukprot:COSAG01_NODE_36520_length_516_cov_1.978417_2_plen_125_part_01